MKKNIVLFVLFILPIVAYLFFASGVNSFVKLPTVTPHINELSGFTSLSGEQVILTNKITVLGFVGSDILYNKGNAFNLNQKIYNKNYQFDDFQFVMIAPNGTQQQAKDLLEQLSHLSNVSRWNFVFGSPEAIKNYYTGLKLMGGLDKKLGTSNVFIVDKERNLRGRKGDGEYKEGYNTISAADLHNEMSDDVKIILAEYRLALKKNNKRKI
jgi:cell division protein FtsL